MKFVRTVLIIAALVLGWVAIKAEGVAHPARYASAPSSAAALPATTPGASPGA